MENTPQFPEAPLTPFSLPKTRGKENILPENKTENTANTAMQKVAQEAVHLHLAPSFVREGLDKVEAIQQEENPENQKVQEAVSLHLTQLGPVSNPLPTTTQNQPQLQTNSFSTITCHLPDCQELVAVQGRDEEIGALCKDIKEGKWLDIVERYRADGSDMDDLAKDALKAFHNGDLNSEQFSTAIFCWSILDEFPDAKIELQPLFDAQGKIAPKAREAFMQGLIPSPSSSNAPRFFGSDQEVENLTDAFFKNMKQKLPSEQFFFTIDQPSKAYADPDEPTMHNHMEQKIGFRVFDEFLVHDEEGEKRVQMIPSFSMIQALVDAYGGENTVAVCPKIAISTEEDFHRNAQERGRDIFLPFPKNPSPMEADGIGTPDVFQFIRHDIYHCLIASQVPDLCRKEVAQIADCISLLQKQFAGDPDPFTPLYLQSLRATILDMDWPAFQPRFHTKTGDLTRSELLLRELQNSATNIVRRPMWNTLCSELQVDDSESAVTAEQTHLEEDDTIVNDDAPSDFEDTLMEFNKDFDSFCSRTPLLRELAELMYQNGIFDRLPFDTSKERFDVLTQQAASRVNLDINDLNANLVAQLARTLQEHRRSGGEKRGIVDPEFQPNKRQAQL